jgi:Spy/CpxP family protein refolding chaperone
MIGARLALTEDQQTKMQSLHQAQRTEVSGVADELTAARRDLRAETFADARDNAKIVALAAKVSTLEKQLLDLQVRHQTAVADLLTPEQRARLRAAPAGSGRGRGRGPGAGR